MKASLTDVRCNFGHAMVVVDLNLKLPGRPILSCMNSLCGYFKVLFYAPEIDLGAVPSIEAEQRGLK